MVCFLVRSPPANRLIDSESRVMWDIVTQKSKGYGFVAFKEKSDAEDALRRMNGVYVGSRQIRVNWANHRTHSRSHSKFQGMSFEEVYAQSSPFNTTVYVGNLNNSVSGESCILPNFIDKLCR